MKYAWVYAGRDTVRSHPLQCGSYGCSVDTTASHFGPDSWVFCVRAK